MLFADVGLGFLLEPTGTAQDIEREHREVCARLGISEVPFTHDRAGVTLQVHKHGSH